MTNIDEQIRRAMEEGQFDHLPGAGKPLRLDENPYEDPDWRLAYHVLRSNGFSLPWIELRREIEDEIEAARNALREALTRRQERDAQGVAMGEGAVEWQSAVALFCERVAGINRQILTYNLEAPSTLFHARLLNANRELELTVSMPSDTLASTDLD
jgi:DnaJ homolog subfamily C member 28